MKNFPDHNRPNELEKRLQEYTEQPDDQVWKNIDNALRPNRTPAWFRWVDRFTSATSILLLTLFVSSGSDNKNVASSELALNSSEHSESNLGKNESLPELSQQHDGSRSKAMESVDRPASNPTMKRVSPSTSDRNKRSEYLEERKGNDQRIYFPDTAALFSSDRLKENAGIETSRDGTDSIFVLSFKEQVDSSFNKNKSPQPPRRLPKRGIAFYVSVTPQLSFQRVIPVGEDGIVISKFYNQSVLSTDRFGVSIDAGVQGHITKRLEYHGGISIYSQRQALKYEYQSRDHTRLESSDDLNYIITPESSTGIVNYEMLNLGVNAGILYHLRGNKLQHKIGAGLSYQQGFKKSSGEAYDNAGSNYLFYQLFYRNEVRVGARTKIFVQPTFSHSIYTSEKLNTPFNLKPYRAGLGFGFLYDF